MHYNAQSEEELKSMYDTLMEINISNCLWEVYIDEVVFEILFKVIKIWDKCKYC